MASRTRSEHISEQAGKRGAQLPPEVAAVVGDPVRADVIEARPVGPDSGNGQTPFFLAFLASLSGFIGTVAIYLSVEPAAEGLAARRMWPSRTGQWTTKLLLGLLYAALVAAADLWVAFGLLGVEHEASTTQVYLFLTLAVAAAVGVTMLLATVLGAGGIALGVILTVILGLVSSGGFAPLEVLPPFYQAYADWLPLRYAVDGLRSLLLYDGTLDAARLEEGLRDALPFSGDDRRSDAGGSRTRSGSSAPTLPAPLCWGMPSRWSKISSPHGARRSLARAGCKAPRQTTEFSAPRKEVRR